MKTWNPFAAMNPSGIGQQTLVGQVIGTGGSATRASPVRRKRRAGKKTAARRARSSPAKRASKRRAKPARLVKGSAAAKAYMAKIRRKRRK